MNTGLGDHNFADVTVWPHLTAAAMVYGMYVSSPPLPMCGSLLCCAGQNSHNVHRGHIAFSWVASPDHHYKGECVCIRSAKKTFPFTFLILGSTVCFWIILSGLKCLSLGFILWDAGDRSWVSQMLSKLPLHCALAQPQRLCHLQWVKNVRPSQWAAYRSGIKVSARHL